MKVVSVFLSSPRRGHRGPEG